MNKAHTGDTGNTEAIQLYMGLGTPYYCLPRVEQVDRIFQILRKCKCPRRKALGIQ